MSEPITNSTTSLTLLELLRSEEPDSDAWQEFFQLYHPRIRKWCKQWGAQDADADDVAQMVLLKLASRLNTFQYNPERSFRAFIKTMTQHIWSDLAAWGNRTAASGESSIGLLLSQVQAREDLERRLAEDFDHELLEQAINEVRQRVAEKTWEAFRLTAMEGLSGASAAKQLNMPVAHVFVAKQRVRKLLQNAVQKMIQDDPSP